MTFFTPSPAPPTPFPELNDVLRALVEGVQAVLEDNFAGLYLQGSFAVGGFDQHSDVDFIVAVEAEPTEAQVDGLQAMHPRLYRLPSEWARHLEGSYFPKPVLRDYAQSGGQLWFLDHGSRSLEKSNHCNTIVTRWTVRKHGLALAGPAPASLIDPIPVAALRREILATMNDWGREILAEPERFDNHFYQTFIVLSYCRMLRDFLAGDVGSKRAGAEWAKVNLDPSWAGLIDRTWAGRPDPAQSVRQPADPADFQHTLQFVEYAIRKSRRYAAALDLGPGGAAA